MQEIASSLPPPIPIGIQISLTAVLPLMFWLKHKQALSPSTLVLGRMVVVVVK